MHYETVTVLADGIGAALRPGYSVTGQAISELIERGAPNKALIDVLLLGFHGLVIPFAVHPQAQGPVGAETQQLLFQVHGVLDVQREEQALADDVHQAVG